VRCACAERSSKLMRPQDAPCALLASMSQDRVRRPQRRPSQRSTLNKRLRPSKRKDGLRPTVYSISFELLRENNIQQKHETKFNSHYDHCFVGLRLANRTCTRRQRSKTGERQHRSK